MSFNLRTLFTFMPSSLQSAKTRWGEIMSSTGRGFGQSGDQNFDGKSWIIFSVRPHWIRGQISLEIYGNLRCFLPGGRPNKFLYSGKNKKVDPWGSSTDNDHEDSIERALQPKNKFLKTKDTRSSPGKNIFAVKWLLMIFVSVYTTVLLPRSFIA